MSLWYILLTRTVSLSYVYHNTYTALWHNTNSDAALPWGLVAPEASEIIPCKQQPTAARCNLTKKKKKSRGFYQILEERADVQLHSVAGCCGATGWCRGLEDIGQCERGEKMPVMRARRKSQRRAISRS